MLHGAALFTVIRGLMGLWDLRGEKALEFEGSMASPCPEMPFSQTGALHLPFSVPLLPGPALGSWSLSYFPLLSGSFILFFIYKMMLACP